MSLCGLCGDKKPEIGEHVCWVRQKMKTPSLPCTCPKCGELMRFDTCWRPACVNSAG